MKAQILLLIILLSFSSLVYQASAQACQNQVNCKQAFSVEQAIFQKWFNDNANSIEAFYTFNQVTSTFLIQMVYQNPAFVYINDLATSQYFLQLNGDTVNKVQFNTTVFNQRSLQNLIVTTEIPLDQFNNLNCSELNNNQIKVCPFEFRIYNQNYENQIFGSVFFDIETFAQNTSSVEPYTLIYLKAKQRSTQINPTEQQVYQFAKQYQNLSYSSTEELNYENITDIRYQEQQNPEYLWGTYKPYLLYGLTQRKDQPLTMRFLYSMDDNKKDTSNLRYTPKDSADDNLIANFIQHNGIDYCNQEIIDRYYNLQFNTIFLKQNSTKNKQKWSSILQFDETNSKQFDQFEQYWDKQIINYFTIGLESWSGLDNGDYLVSKVNSTNTIEHRAANTGLQGYFQIRLFVNNEEVTDLQKYGLTMTNLETINKQQNWDIENAVYWTNYNAEPSTMLNSKENSIPKAKNDVQGATVALIKLKIPTNLNYSIVIDYESISFIEWEQKYTPVYLSLSELQNLQQIRSDNFTEQFQQLFLNNLQANDTQYNKCSEASLSNLLGGMNFMFGPVLIDQWNCYVQPKTLFSGTPARAGFPRGFLWDDGFHQLLFCQWNHDLCMMVQESWLNTQLPQGWINREQIRGYEVENYANQNFMIQLIKQSNPPSIMLSLEKLFDYMYDGEEINENIYQFFQRNYNFIFNYYYWYINDYQAPNTSEMVYRWQTLDYLYYLDSGMDDWPRNSGNYLAKYQVDLHTWVTLFTKNLLKFAKVFGSSVEIAYLENNFDTLMTNLDKYYLDPSDNLYKDVLQSIYNDSQIYSPHQGYVNIFPLFFGLMNETSPAFNATLNLIKNETVMWSQFGLRSLALNDFFWGTASYYWRGPIWINIQYLLLKGIYENYPNNEYAMQVYEELRANVIDVVCQNYYGKGYFYENFDSHTGLGQDNHPFTGWTTLVSLMINSFDNVRKTPQTLTS